MATQTHPFLQNSLDMAYELALCWVWGWGVNSHTWTSGSPLPCLAGLFWDAVQGDLKYSPWRGQQSCTKEGMFSCCPASSGLAPPPPSLCLSSPEPLHSTCWSDSRPFIQFPSPLGPGSPGKPTTHPSPGHSRTEMVHVAGTPGADPENKLELWGLIPAALRSPPA